jgi:hypothetical protein
MTLRVNYKLGATDNKRQDNQSTGGHGKLTKNKNIFLTVIVKTGHALRLLFGFKFLGPSEGFTRA